MTDNELKRMVENALHGEVRLHGRAITVEVEDGQVALRGEVSQLAEKRLALNLVRKVKEIGEVKDALRLPSAGELSDAQIIQHINDAMVQDATLHEHQLKAASQDGCVTLTGWVDSIEEKRLMGLSAWWVPGVVDVDNRVEVIPAHTGNDGDLVDIIRVAFEKDVLIDPNTIGITARGPVVTLMGSVRSEEERLAAEHDAYYIWGVDEVINRIDVVPR